MELLNHNSVTTGFQQTLKTVTFKTVYQDRLEVVGYDKLFADQRVIILSVPIFFFHESFVHLTQYKSEFENLTKNNIDNIYVVNSFNPMVASIADTVYKPILGLFDSTKEFVSALATEIESTKDINFLSRRWEYVAIINNGNLERFWQNVIPESISLRHYRYGHKHIEWELHGKVQNIGSLHYRKLGPTMVLDYLKNSVDTKQ